MSGTASIVGHHSRCVGDLEGQLRVTFENIDALLERGGQEAQRNEKLQMSLIKVYLRFPRDLAAVSVAVQFPPPTRRIA